MARTEGVGGGGGMTVRGAGDVAGIFHFPATFLPLHLTGNARGKPALGERLRLLKGSANS